jgi:hypothetical protein
LKSTDGWLGRASVGMVEVAGILEKVAVSLLITAAASLMLVRYPSDLYGIFRLELSRGEFWRALGTLVALIFVVGGAVLVGFYFALFLVALRLAGRGDLAIQKSDDVVSFVMAALMTAKGLIVCVVLGRLVMRAVDLDVEFNLFHWLVDLITQ